MLLFLKTFLRNYINKYLFIFVFFIFINFLNYLRCLLFDNILIEFLFNYLSLTEGNHSLHFISFSYFLLLPLNLVIREIFPKDPHHCFLHDYFDFRRISCVKYLEYYQLIHLPYYYFLFAELMVAHSIELCFPQESLFRDTIMG